MSRLRDENSRVHAGNLPKLFLTMKILCISSKAHPGVSAVFQNFIQIVENSQHKYVEDLEYKDICCGNDMVIFGAWHNDYSNLIQNCEGKRAILWTSSVSQMQTTPEEIEVKIFNQLVDGVGKWFDYLLIGDKDLAEMYKSEKILWFPYPIAFSDHPLMEKKENVFGLFCTDHFRKNILNQILATKHAHKQYPSILLITNCYKKDEGIIPTGWLEKEAYAESLKKITFGLNVFPHESFAYSFSELMMRGVPTLCSKRIAENFKLPKYLRHHLEIQDSDSSMEISEAILILSCLGEKHRNQLSSTCKEYIKLFSLERNREVNKLFSNLEYQTNDKKESSTETTG